MPISKYDLINISGGSYLNKIFRYVLIKIKLIKVKYFI